MEDFKRDAFYFYHDGSCPLCMLEYKWIRHLDKNKNIHFVDIQGPCFEKKSKGRAKAEFEFTLQGYGPKKGWVEGVEVFRQVYDRLGYGWWVNGSRMFPFRSLLEGMYAVFKIIRIPLGRMILALKK